MTSRPLFDTTEEQFVCNEMLAVYDDIQRTENIDDVAIMIGVLGSAAMLAYYSINKRQLNLWIQQDHDTIVEKFSAMLKQVSTNMNGGEPSNTLAN